MTATLPAVHYNLYLPVVWVRPASFQELITYLAFFFRCCVAIFNIRLTYHFPSPPPLHCGLLPFSTSLQIPVGFSLHNRPVYVVFFRLRFMWFRFLFMTIEFQTDDRQVQKGHGASLHINQLRQRKKR